MTTEQFIQEKEKELRILFREEFDNVVNDLTKEMRGSDGKYLFGSSHLESILLGFLRQSLLDYQKQVREMVERDFEVAETNRNFIIRRLMGGVEFFEGKLKAFSDILNDELLK